MSCFNCRLVTKLQNYGAVVSDVETLDYQHLFINLLSS